MGLVKFKDAINQAIQYSMHKDKSMMCFGLGVTDPKHIFGTTHGLEENFGSQRVFDMPTSENAMTGISIGAALNGVRSIVSHQRLDFFLLAMDQLVNGAAKYYYMYGSKMSVPITIRLIIGRGWGQGPTHSQNLQAWFAHIPGLKVVMPSTSEDARNLLIASIFDPNPVLFLEHRWLHETIGEVSEDIKIEKPIQSKVIRKGKDVTIVSMSYMTIESIHAANFLSERLKIESDIIDLRSIKPINWDPIISSLKKTGQLVVVDSGFTTGSVAGEIIAYIATNYFKLLKCPPIRLAMPDVPEPTSAALTKDFYIRAREIAQSISKSILNDTSIVDEELKNPEPHDIPGDWFKGPF